MGVLILQLFAGYGIAASNQPPLSEDQAGNEERERERDGKH